jgi:hypothetical protein
MKVNRGSTRVFSQASAEDSTEKVSHARNTIPWARGFPQERLDELIRAGCEGPKVEAVLIVLASVAKMPLSAEVKIFPEGLTKRQLKYLPKQVKQLAEDVELVNKNKYYDPQLFVRKSTETLPQFAVIKRDFRTLPGILRLYAEFIESRTRELGKFRKGPGKAGAVNRDLIRKLMKYVRGVTRRPFYDALADLLSFVLPDDDTYSAEVLRQLDSRPRSS